jgi:hypothetical protein
MRLALIDWVDFLFEVSIEIVDTYIFVLIETSISHEIINSASKIFLQIITSIITLLASYISLFDSSSLHAYNNLAILAFYIIIYSIPSIGL